MVQESKTWFNEVEIEAYGNNLPPFFGCAHRYVLSLAQLCRYSNTHPNPLQNPLGVCVPVYKL